MQQNIGRSLKIIGMAIGAIAGTRIAAEDFAEFEIPVYIARDENIEPPVFIVIEESDRSSPAFDVGVCLFRHVRKSAVAVVMVKRRAAVARHVKVCKSV